MSGLWQDQEQNQKRVAVLAAQHRKHQQQQVPAKPPRNPPDSEEDLPSWFPKVDLYEKLKFRGTYRTLETNSLRLLRRPGGPSDSPPEPDRVLSSIAWWPSYLSPPLTNARSPVCAGGFAASSCATGSGLPCRTSSSTSVGLMYYSCLAVLGGWYNSVVRERTSGRSCPQIPAGGLSARSCWSCNQQTLIDLHQLWRCLTKLVRRKRLRQS